jgi:phosphatidylinositol alpha-1,6-mannosyltransferase
MKRPAQILFLTLDMFKTTGGIQKVCRTLAYALMNDKAFSNRSTVYSAYDELQDSNHRYINETCFKGFGKNKISFSKAAIYKGIKSNIIIISHIHLLNIAICIKILNPGVRIILIAHGVEVWKKIHPLSRLFIQKYIEAFCVSDYTRKTMASLHQIKPETLKTLNNGIDPYFEIPDNFERPASLLKKYNLYGDQPVLLTISRINAQERLKGYELVLKALPELLLEFPNLHYLLGGQSEKSEKQHIIQLIKILHLQNHVSLIDFIHETELSAHYLLADAFVLPSQKEGFGLVFIEAAACGCKVIAGNKDGSTDALINGALGLMIDPENKTALQNAIKEAIRSGRNPIIARKIQQRCLKHFSYESYVENLKKELN